MNPAGILTCLEIFEDADGHGAKRYVDEESSQHYSLISLNE